MEFAVGVMLVLLGVLTLTGAGRRGGAAIGHRHAHAHGDYVHSHPHAHDAAGHGHAEDRTPLAELDRSILGGLPMYQYARPLVVGLVHGLAGSAAIALLVLTIIREPAWAIGYLLLFGVGTIGGMMLITLRACRALRADLRRPAALQLAASGGLGAGELLVRLVSCVRYRLCGWRAVHAEPVVGAALSEKGTGAGT